jgi:hypothetical protein
VRLVYVALRRSAYAWPAREALARMLAKAALRASALDAGRTPPGLQAMVGGQQRPCSGVTMKRPRLAADQDHPPLLPKDAALLERRLQRMSGCCEPAHDLRVDSIPELQPGDRCALEYRQSTQERGGPERAEQLLDLGFALQRRVGMHQPPGGGKDVMVDRLTPAQAELVGRCPEYTRRNPSAEDNRESDLGWKEKAGLLEQSPKPKARPAGRGKRPVM